MPWSVAAAVGGSLVSSALSPSSSGGGSGGQGYYVPSGLSSADIAWQDLLAKQVGLQQAGNIYGAGYQNAANLTAPQYSGLANMANAYSNVANYQAGNAYDAQRYLQGAGQNVFNLALDPQSALYNRTQQQLTDQVNAGQALRGLGTSAVGGQEYNQAMSNFNIDWQNQQLSRALQGAQGLGSLYGQAGSYGQLGNQELAQSLGYAGQVPQYTLAGGQTPYQTSQSIYNNAIAQAQGIQGQIIPYLNYGQGAVQNAFNQQSQAAGAAGALANQGISGLGSAFGNLFGSGGGSGFGYSGTGSLFGTDTGSYGSYGGFGGTSPVTGFTGGGANYSIPSFGFGG